MTEESFSIPFLSRHPTGGFHSRLSAFFFCALVLFGSRLEAAWRPQASGVTADLNSLSFTDSNTGWAVGQSATILRTTNGGDAWSAQTTTVSATLHDVHFINSSTGVIVGSGGTILKTVNGGATWLPRASGTSSTLFGVFWVSTGTVWAVGQSGTILKSIDGADTWSSGDPGGFAPAGQNLREVFFVNVSTGWAVGTGGALIRTDDGGNNWSAQAGSTQTLRGVFFVSVSTGWIVGDKGTIQKTVNGGNAWTSQISTTTGFTGVHFISTATGWVVGDSGVVMRSTDSGATFQQETSTASDSLSKVFALTDTVGYAVGASGRILSNGAVAASTAPAAVPQAQGTLGLVNNLFDPSQGASVHVHYSSKKDGQVSVRVYDLHGRLVRTLLDEIRTAGEYQDLNWDGRNDQGETVASGVYLLHIEGPEFSLTRKVIAVR